jgi:hypothetical protein
LLVILLLAVWQMVRYLAVTSGRAGRDAVDLATAARMGGRFRDDVRQALDVSVAEQGRQVDLVLPGSTVRYRRGSDARLERMEGEIVDKGPFVQSVSFDFVASTRLLRARWVCGDQPDGPVARPREALREARVLVFDTALRVDAREGTTP